LAQHNRATTLELRRKLAAKAYARTAAYDAAIANWFAQRLDDPAPAYRAIGGRLIEPLRYGENPHQSAAFYRTPEQRPGVATARLITRIFTEVIIAPDASEEAIAIVAAKKNLRLLLAGGLPDPRAAGIMVKSVAGGLLVQSRDNAVVDDMMLKVVTKRAPTNS